MKPDLIVLSDRGLYCREGDFYIDPWKPVPFALITHGHSDHAHPGHTRYLAHEHSLPIMKLRLGKDTQIETTPYGKPLQIGNVKVSFHPAGHILGSSQVRVEHEGEVWVFTGDYKRDPDPSCVPFEVVRCNTLITEATFALPIYKWTEGTHETKLIYEWWMENKKRGWNSILCAYVLGKTQRVLAELLDFTNEAVHLHGAMEKMVDIYREAGIRMVPTLPTSHLTKKDKLQGALIIAPPSASGSTWTRKFEPYEVGFASGWMQIRGNKRRKAYDRGFVVSDHADWPSLIKTIRDSGASRVIATHGSSDVLARYVTEEMGLKGEVFKTYYGEEETGEDTESPEGATSETGSLLAIPKKSGKKATSTESEAGTSS